MTRPRYDLGAAVRVVRNVRDDGTYPGAVPGDLLIRCGSAGTVIDIGTFLVDQIIYTVHFLDADRIVGCREEELIEAAAPWLPSLFNSRERVVAQRRLALSAAGDSIAPGAAGEVLRVLRDGAQPVYHVHFDCLPGRVFAVPEAALRAPEGAEHG